MNDHCADNNRWNVPFFTALRWNVDIRITKLGQGPVRQKAQFLKWVQVLKSPKPQTAAENSSSLRHGETIFCINSIMDPKLI